MSEKQKNLVESIIKNEGNSPDVVARYVLQQKGYNIFEKNNLSHILFSLNFLATYFSALIKHNSLSYADKMLLEIQFKEQTGFPIEFLS